MAGFQDKVGFIWSVADLLRGDYKPHDYGKVILPLTVLRRLDCVLEPTKAEVLKQAKGLKRELGWIAGPVVDLQTKDGKPLGRGEPAVGRLHEATDLLACRARILGRSG